ncbi:MAG TPA: response regulator, partial [Asticcacaulis sp.]
NFMDLTALILEDSATQAQIIGRMLEADGWHYIHCETVREASEALTQMQVHALLLDIYVGQHNSLLHIERFKAMAPGAPLIFMSAGGGGADAMQTLSAARRAGAAYVLRKPFTPGTLRGIMGAIEQDRLKGRKRPHVLVIDDSRTVRKMLVNSFKSADYRVSEAGSMEAAFADCDIAHVDLAVCDIFMPGMGGVQGMAMLKQAWPRIGVIAMSAGMDGQMTEAQALEAAARVGADSCIAKPFTAQVLLLRAESVLKAKQMAQKAGEPA